MRRPLIYVLHTLFFFLSLPLHAQFYMDGGESAFLRRKELRVENFRIIYPLGADSAAQRVADVVRYNLPTVNLTSRRVNNFPIVLRHRTTYSNGFVAWTPARMECYSMSAGESVEPTPWLTHLLSHELRHYAQMNALNWNALGTLSYFLGEQAVALGAAVTPRWFLEGDAMYYESAHGRIGRLHSALTYQHYRTELLTGQHLSYDQYLNGSYKYFVPTHYEFGALMVAQGYAQYGAMFWPEVLNYTTWHAYRIFPFYFALKKFAGQTRPQLFQQALDALVQRTRETDTIPEVQRRGKYQSQLYPHYSPTTQKYYYLQRSYDEWQTLCAKEDLLSKDAMRIAPIRSVKGSIRYSDTVAAWVQLNPNPFFTKEQEANIWLCNLTTGTVRKLTEGTHALSPQPYTALGIVRAIELTPTGAYTITERSLKTGELLALERASFGNMELRELTRGENEHSSLLRAVSDEGAFVLQYDWRTRRLDTVLPPVKLDLAYLSCDSAGMYFSATHNFVRRGFFLPWNKGQGDTLRSNELRLQQLKLSPYGSEYVQLCDTAVLYAAYTINGYEVRRVPRQVTDTLALSALVPQLLFRQPEPYAQPRRLEHTPANPSAARHYSPLRNMLHWHSWAPFYMNPKGDIETLSDIMLGVSAMSQNPTATLAVYGGYFYNHGHGGSLAIDWLGTWPRISLGLYTDERTMSYRTLAGQYAQQKRYYHTQLALSFPYRWGEGMYNHTLSGRLGLSVNNLPSVVYWKKEDQLYETTYGVRTTLRAGLSYSMLRLTPRQNLYPKWGFRVGVTGRSVVYPARLFGNVYELQATGYAPGFGATHGVRLSLYTILQQRHALMQNFSLPSRGLWFDAPSSLRRGLQLFKADVDYALPLLYQDLNLFSTVYLKRVSTYFFFSYRLYETLRRQVEQTRVLGVEVLHDFHLLRAQYPWQWGYTLSFLPFGDPLGPQSRAKWSIQATLNVNFGAKE